MFSQFNDATVAALGLGLLLAGFTAFYIAGRRRFVRLNAAGIEEFRSYPAMLVTRLLERLLKLAGLVAILAGVALMFAGVQNNMARKRAAGEQSQRVVMTSKSVDKMGVLAKQHNASRQQ